MRMTLLLLMSSVAGCGGELDPSPSPATGRAALYDPTLTPEEGEVINGGGAQIRTCYTDLADLYEDGAVAARAFCGRAGGRIYPVLNAERGCYEASVVCYNTGTEHNY